MQLVNVDVYKNQIGVLYMYVHVHTEYVFNITYTLCIHLRLVIL